MKKERIVIKPKYNVKILGIHEHLQEVKRGTGVVRPKKGKGSYTRKIKHKKDLFGDWE